jgi:hypothetical protein
MAKRLLATLGFATLCCSLARDVDRFSEGPVDASFDAGDGSGGSTGWPVDGALDASPCKPPGESCAAFSECCSLGCSQGACDACQGPESSCATSSDCCSGLECHLGGCSACKADGAPCTLAADCCSESCSSGTCNACAGEGESCSSGCCPGHQCVGQTCEIRDACTPADEAVIAQGQTVVSTAVCYTWHDPDEATILDCMGSMGLTRLCSRCLLALLPCIASNCFAPCDFTQPSFDPSECQACCASSCTTDFFACSGIDFCPP